MDNVFILLVLVLIIALVATIGGLFVLLRQQVVVDEKGAVSQIDLPFFGKLSTNYPSLVAVLLGISLSFYVATKLDPQITVKHRPLVAQLNTSELPPDSYIFVSAVPQRYLTATNALGPDGQSLIRLMVDEPGPYNVIAYTVTKVEDGRSIYAVTHGPAILSPDTDEFWFQSRLVGRDKLEAIRDANGN